MTDHRNRRMPAIVLGRGYTALGALRCLAMAGIPAYVACPRGDLATHSRYFRPLPGAPWDGRLDAHAADALRAMPIDRAVLIAGADDAALWLADLPASGLGDRYLASASSRDTLGILQDKMRFGAFLAQSGIPHPRTFEIDSHQDIAAVPFGDLDRVFVKPVDSQRFMRAYGVKGYWAANRSEFERIWQRLDAEGHKVVAQEYVPGASSDHYFVDGFRDRDGALSGLFARRRLRIHPPWFGNSSYCRSIPLAEVAGAVDSLDALLAQLRYRGIFSAEFKRDARNGEFRILEVNTRAWWYVEFAARCGVNVCAMAYRDAKGEAVPASPRNYRVGAGCVNLIDDARSVMARGAPSTPLAVVLGQWLRAHRHVYRTSDPMPALRTLARDLTRWLEKAVRKCLPRPKTA